jgi:hypothetical protein
MYRRHILRTFHIAVKFLIVLHKWRGRGRGEGEPSSHPPSLCPGWGGEGGGGPSEGVGPENHTKLTTCRRENTIHYSKSHVHKITNVPVFLWPLDLMILMGANSLHGPLEGMSSENLDFFGTTLLIAISGPKNS